MSNEFENENEIDFFENNIDNEFNEELEKNTSLKETIDEVTIIWNTQESQNQNLRKIFSYWMIGVLVFQVFLLNLVILISGFKCCHFELDESILKLYLSLIFAKILGLIFLIVKYLFNRKDDKILDSIINLHKKP